MNKSELVEAVAGQVGDRRAAAAAVEAVLGTVMRAVRDGEPVALSGFGVFEKVDRAARSARNPSTGAAVAVAATSSPRFRPGQVFKDVVSGKRELPEPSTPVARTAPAAVEAVTADEPDAPDVDAGPSADEPRAKGPGSKRASTKQRSTTKKDTTKKDSTKKAGGKKASGKDKKGKKAGKK